MVIIKQEHLLGFKYSIKKAQRKGFILICQKCGESKNDMEDFIEIHTKTIPILIKELNKLNQKEKSKNV